MSDDPPERRRFRLGALEQRPFRYLLAAGMAMQLGGWIQRIALLWVVFEITGSAVQLAGLGFASSIFVLVISPFSGPLADSFGARRVLMGASLFQAVAAIIVAVAVFTGHASLPLLYAVGIAHGIGQALNQPMRNLLVYDAVGRDKLRNGLALNALTGNLMRVVGPSLGGVMVAARGADLAFAAQAVLLIGSVVLVGRLHVDVRRSAMRLGGWRELGGGLAHLRENQAVRVNICMALLVSALVYPYMQFMPVFVTENLGGDELELGIMQSAVGVGSLIGLWYVVAGRGGTATMLWAGVVYMAGVAAFAQIEHLWVAFAVLSVAGVAHSLFSTLNQALVQLNTDEEYRARVMGLYTMTNGIEPFTLLALGVIVEFAGASIAIGAASGVAAVVTLRLALSATRSAIVGRRQAVAATETPPAT
ncbi:MAG: MFS transporter [Dehalococcoidia bacterium]|nr:MFS transporter [Dehalococcoidia bacterium]